MHGLQTVVFGNDARSVKEVAPRKESATWSSAPSTARGSPWFKHIWSFRALRIFRRTSCRWVSECSQWNQWSDWECDLRWAVRHSRLANCGSGGLCGLEGRVGDVNDVNFWGLERLGGLQQQLRQWHLQSGKTHHSPVPSSQDNPLLYLNVAQKCFTCLFLRSNIVLKRTEFHQTFKMERYGKDRNHSEITPKFNIFHNVPCNLVSNRCRLKRITAAASARVTAKPPEARCWPTAWWHATLATLPVFIVLRVLEQNFYLTHLEKRGKSNGMNGMPHAVSGCFLKPCPINCQWTDWSAWTDCSSSCGTGQQSRSRSVAVQPQFEGTLCEARRELKI